MVGVTISKLCTLLLILVACVFSSGLSKTSDGTFCSLKWVPLYKQGAAQRLIPLAFQTGHRMRYSPLYCVYTAKRTIFHDDKTINLHFSGFFRVAEVHFKVFPLFTTNRISKHSFGGSFQGILTNFVSASLSGWRLCVMPKRSAVSTRFILIFSQIFLYRVLKRTCYGCLIDNARCKKQVGTQ
jgi:hypothetical protein